MHGAELSSAAAGADIAARGVPRLLFVGPLPPPVHGFSVINAGMLARFQAAGSVAVFNRAPVAGRGAWRRAFGTIAMGLRFAAQLAASPAGSTVYLGLSGGLGQLKDLPFVLSARLLQRRLLVHHHSFAYLRQRGIVSRAVLGLLRPARHIALCDCMAQALCRGYGIQPSRIQVLSNAAFLPAAESHAKPARNGPLHLGFLSNISAEKGIWLFIELVDALVAQGVPVRASIAGPAAPEVATRLTAELAQRPQLVHLGPVYDARKQAFFDDIDVLIFPTLYRNEAEPVTILEAQRAGVPVVANARGCIADMLPEDAGVVLHDDARFVEQAAVQLRAWAHQDSAAWAARQAAAQHGFEAQRAEHASRVAALVAEAMPAASTH